MDDRAAWFPQKLVGLAGILVSAAGLACCITLLNLGSRVVMGLGGFVAVGGPYEIAHPAPGWVGLIPLSIIAGFVFGGLSVVLSSRTEGFSLILIPLAWSGLFLSLGYQFAVMGLNPPGGGGIAWGWIICALVFIPLGLMPLLALFAGRNPFRVSGGGGASQLYAAAPDKMVYLACVAIGGIGGILGGLALFSAVAG